ncbi:MAG: DUF4349 domain-containing protein [Clostridiales bacterium]|jgi:hypothetical protein|nr:DUF4349 domain-containing protein [Clostridiales bacterium]
MRNKITASVILLTIIAFAYGCGQNAVSDPSTSARYARMDEAYGYAETAPRDGSFSSSSASSYKSRKVITNGDMKAETDDYDETLRQIRVETERSGGYFESAANQTLNGSGKGLREFDAIIKIPWDKFDVVRNNLIDMGIVTFYEQSTIDATGEFYDLSRRLNAKIAAETRLIELIAEAQNAGSDITEIIEMETALSNIREEKEMYKARISYIDDSAAYSALSLRLTEIGEGLADGFGARITNSFSKSASFVKMSFEAVAVFLAAAVVPILAIGFLTLVCALLIKKRKTLRSPD